MDRPSPDATSGRDAAPAAIGGLTSADLDAVFGAVAHAARRQMLVILHVRGGSMTAGQIASRFRHAWPTTTRHLGVLERAGLVRVESRGRERHYTLDRDRLAAAASWCGWASEPAAESSRADESWKDLPFGDMPARRDEEDTDAS